MSRRRSVSSVPAVALVTADSGVPAVAFLLCWLIYFGKSPDFDGVPTFAGIPAVADTFDCAVCISAFSVGSVALLRSTTVCPLPNSCSADRVETKNFVFAFAQNLLTKFFENYEKFRDRITLNKETIL